MAVLQQFNPPLYGRFWPYKVGISCFPSFIWPKTAIQRGKNDLEAKKDGKNTYYLPVLGHIEFSAFVVKLSQGFLMQERSILSPLYTNTTKTQTEPLRHVCLSTRNFYLKLMSSSTHSNKKSISITGYKSKQRLSGQDLYNTFCL